MGIKERREREKADVRGKILDAARELFVEHGYEAVTMRAIADQIEYSPTAIYVHFKDKESLMRELCREDFGAMAAGFAELSHVSDPVERIRAIGLSYIHFAVEQPNHFRLMFMTATPRIEPTADDLKRMDNPDEDAYAFLRSTVEEGIRAGRFRTELNDADLIAQTLWAAVHGVATIQITKNDDPWLNLAPLDLRAHTAADAVLRGMLRNPEQYKGHLERGPATGGGL